VSNGLFGTSCTIHIDEESVFADIHVPGTHQVANAMAAVRVAKLLGLTKEEIERGIASVRPIGGRNHIIKGANYTVIDDCYNANPVSMKAALELLSEANGRRVAILGDMFELGADSDRLHEQVGAYCLQTKADVLICIGEHAQHIYEGARKAQEEIKREMGLYHFKTKGAFLKQKEQILEAGDTVLLKASHGMAFETLLKELD
jgi:UDP-N-acetylmuramoyl-tripeptide--D-alanyl-D-alanine ligase